jgi:hypothetical protein
MIVILPYHAHSIGQVLGVFFLQAFFQTCHVGGRLFKVSLLCRTFKTLGYKGRNFSELKWQDFYFIFNAARHSESGKMQRICCSTIFWL